MPIHNVHLTVELDSFADDKIQSGRYDNASEVIPTGSVRSNNLKGKTGPRSKLFELLCRLGLIAASQKEMLLGVSATHQESS